jgi:hypothetical protein
MNRILIMTISALMLAGCAASLPRTAAADAYSDKPNPDPISCAIRPIQNMALLEERVCKRRSEWASMNRAGFADGGQPSHTVAWPWEYSNSH